MGNSFPFRGRHKPFDRQHKQRSPFVRRASFVARHAGFLALAALLVGGWYSADHWYGLGGVAQSERRIVRHDIEQTRIGDREIRYATGPRYEAVDGDSLRAGSEEIRLAGIDAPELYQTCRTGGGRDWACGREAHARLRTLVTGGQVRCQGSGRDRYERTLARCSAGPAADLGEVMVREGLAINFMNGGYEAAEAEARKAKRGIWSGSFEEPADYRRSSRRAER